MASTVINTREDLDAITGTPEHAAFMSLLAGTLWRLEKDDTAQAWVAIEDNSTIERFSFTRADFPDAQPPALPEYVPKVVAVPEVVTMRQARLALLAAGKLAGVESAIASMPEPHKTAAQIEWEYSNALQRSNPFVSQIGAALGLDESGIDALFVEAAKL